MSVSFTSLRTAVTAPVLPSATPFSTTYAYTPLQSWLQHENVLAGTFTPSLVSTPTACDTADEIVIVISTAVTVSNFEHVYHQDVHHFKPRYAVTSDGSLISGPLAKDLRDAGEALLWLGGYIIFFAWNSIAALSFIVRTTVPNKSIFYVLLASQVLALTPSIIQVVIAFESDRLDCQSAFIAVEVMLALSTGLALTGVFGMKAYRCLFNSRWVLVGLAFLEAAHIAAVALRIVRTKARRRLNGFCNLDNPDDLAAVILICLFVESLFIAVCFSIAVWRTSRILTAHGRLSFRDSVFDNDRSPGHRSVIRNYDHPSTYGQPPPIVARVQSASLASVPLVSPTRREKGNEQGKTRKRLTKSSRLYPPKARRPLVAVKSWMDTLKMKILDLFITSRSLHIAVLKPRIQLFREVMRDELYYTALLVAVSVLSASLTLVASWMHMFLRQDQWLTFQLAVMSVLAVHSLRRVVRRNEHEHLLNDRRVGDVDGLARARWQLDHGRASSARSIEFASPHTASDAISLDSGVIDLDRLVCATDSASLSTAPSGQVSL